jgi:hypothetical protein
MLADVGSLEKVASRFDIAMLHKREVDIVNGVTPAQGTHLTAIIETRLQVGL